MMFTRCQFFGTVPVFPVATYDECEFVDIQADQLPDPAQCKDCVVIDNAGNEREIGRDGVLVLNQTKKGGEGDEV